MSVRPSFCRFRFRSRQASMKIGNQQIDNAKVDLYNNSYGNYESEIYRAICIETYGQDLGQTSWVTLDESNTIPKLLELTPESNVLEVGCGSGGYALRVAEQVGCRILGVDINANGISTAHELARRKNLDSLARFEQRDVSKELPYEGASFDAVFANDVLCHIPNRLHVLRELFGMLMPGGRLLFSDALVIGGMISYDEIATRSSIGYYVFSPPGENERLLQAAGFQVLSTTDTSQQAAAIAKRRFDARQARQRDLVAIEGDTNFTGVQQFLACVHKLTSERRLLRYVYLARKDR